MIVCRLKELMIQYDLTQSKISDETGITRPTLLQLIRNENQNIKYDTIEKLCKYFKIGLNELLLYSPFDIKLISQNVYSESTKSGKDITIEIIFELKDKTVIFEETFNQSEGLRLSNKQENAIFSSIEPNDYAMYKQLNTTQIMESLLYMSEDYKTLQEDLYFELHDKLPYEKYPLNLRLVMLEKHITDIELIYSKLDKLNPLQKIALIEELKKSLNKE